MPLSTGMQHFTASDGLKLAYAVDDFSDPWRPQETLILIHAAMGSSRRLYKWIPALSRHFTQISPTAHDSVKTRRLRLGTLPA